MLTSQLQVEPNILRAWLKIFDPEYRFHITSDQFCMGMAPWISTDFFGEKKTQLLIIVLDVTSREMVYSQDMSR